MWEKFKEMKVEREILLYSIVFTTFIYFYSDNGTVFRCA